MRRYIFFSIPILLLSGGFLIYYFFRPEIEVIRFLTVHFHLPIYHLSLSINHSVINFATDHLADILWYASLLFMLLAFIKNNSFKPFYIFFISLPFVLEILKGAGFVPGTFDWLDIFYYLLTFILFYTFSHSLKSIFMKYSFFKSFVPLGILGSFIAFALGSAPTSKISYTTGTLRFAPQQDDNFTKPSLIKYLQSTPNPSIVLRVPNQVGNVVETNNNGEIYNTIETELAKANFIVRDRALFQKVLEQNNSTDYSKIKELTNTDLILELVDFNKAIPYNTNTYTDRRGRERMTGINLMVPGIRVEFRVVQVSNNELVGDYSFNYAPCTTGCLYTFDNYGNLYKPDNLNKKITTPYDYITPDQLQDFFRECTRHLIEELKPGN